MASAAHSTIARIPHPSDAQLGRSARGWESDICDLHNLADLAAYVVEDSLSTPDDRRHLSEGEVNRLLFCVYEVSKRATRFKETYLAAIEAR